ncbi:8-oxo-dGTP diphosphatase [Curtobacterium sp. PhB130]|uniref:(deoxy)nucleoside triphosphate pyrophosphohydrolase n=1 Tax=Curtobacterium sp. PhB130 TaxID=2485178 RepID=UPI000F4C7F8D|nr:(deoxy)nucleoside triphosphate pyrophosphohydrolase [Curtobacterium sp. PhB130]ROS72173.1 8-oxo-dGTP diphosphatase [Curtobacterium sp. PhB130]
MQVIEVVAAVITRDDGEILACRRAPGRASAGLWEFPGGKVERGEHPRDALAREIREELQTEARIGGLVTRESTRVDSLLIDLACYRARIDSAGSLRSTDHDELRWVAASELVRLDWALPDLPAVRVLTDDQSKR